MDNGYFITTSLTITGILIPILIFASSDNEYVNFGKKFEIVKIPVLILVIIEIIITIFVL